MTIGRYETFFPLTTTGLPAAGVTITVKDTVTGAASTLTDSSGVPISGNTFVVGAQGNGGFYADTGKGYDLYEGTSQVQTDVRTIPVNPSQGLTVTAGAPKTAAYTAAAGEFVPVDTTSGNVPITLPSAPPDRTRIGVKQVVQGGTNTVSVACSGTDVFNKGGGATTLVLTLLNQDQIYQYNALTGIWYVTSDDIPLLGLDGRYVGKDSVVWWAEDHGFVSGVGSAALAVNAAAWDAIRPIYPDNVILQFGWKFYEMPDMDPPRSIRLKGLGSWDAAGGIWMGANGTQDTFYGGTFGGTVWRFSTTTGTSLNIVSLNNRSWAIEEGVVLGKAIPGVTAMQTGTGVSGPKVYTRNVIFMNWWRAWYQHYTENAQSDGILRFVACGDGTGGGALVTDNASNANEITYFDASSCWPAAVMTGSDVFTFVAGAVQGCRGSVIDLIGHGLTHIGDVYFENSGAPARINSHAYIIGDVVMENVFRTWIANYPSYQVGHVISDGVNAQQVTAITTGIAGSSTPAWATAINGTTTDGGVTWTNRGPKSLITPAQRLHKCTVGGTSAGSQPAWNTRTGETMTDGGVTWLNMGEQWTINQESGTGLHVDTGHFGGAGDRIRLAGNGVKVGSTRGITLDMGASSDIDLLSTDPSLVTVLQTTTFAKTQFNASSGREIYALGGKAKQSNPFGYEVRNAAVNSYGVQHGADIGTCTVTNGSPTVTGISGFTTTVFDRGKPATITDPVTGAVLWTHNILSNPTSSQYTLGDVVGGVATPVNYTGPTTVGAIISVPGGSWAIEGRGDQANENLWIRDRTHNIRALIIQPSDGSVNDTIPTPAAFPVGEWLGKFIIDKALIQTRVSQTLVANGAVTFDASQGNTLVCVLGATTPFNATSSTVTNATIGQKITLRFVQGTTGGATYPWPTNWQFANGYAPRNVSAPNAQQSSTATYDGTNWIEDGPALIPQLAVRPRAGLWWVDTFDGQDNTPGYDGFSAGNAYKTIDKARQAAAGPGEIRLLPTPGSNYHPLIPMAWYSGLKLVGPGKGICNLKFDGSGAAGTTDIIDFTGAVTQGGTPVSDAIFEGFTITPLSAANPKTAGSLFAIGVSSATSVNLSNKFRYLYLLSCYQEFTIGGKAGRTILTEVDISDFSSLTSRNYGICVTDTATETIIDNFHYASGGLSRTATSGMILIKPSGAVGTTFPSDVRINKAVISTAGLIPLRVLGGQWVYGTTCSFETDQSAFVADSWDGGTHFHDGVDFDGCHFLGGVILKYGNGSKFRGGRIFRSLTHNVDLQGGTYAQFDGVSMHDASQSANGTYDNFHVAAGVSHWSAFRCPQRITNLGNGNLARRALTVDAGGSDNYEFAHNDLDGYVVANGAISDGGTGTHKILTPNYGPNI